MKINELQKQVINNAREERDQLEAHFKKAEQKLIDLLFASTGQSGFSGYEIKEDELILKFPEVKEEVK
jgi:hypothetical protein